MKPAALANVLRMSNIEHFCSRGTVQLYRCENQGTHHETDILRALSYLWRSDQGSL
jgi:hypothetical protein